jgi:hypothetical protein
MQYNISEGLTPQQHHSEVLKSCKYQSGLPNNQVIPKNINPFKKKIVTTAMTANEDKINTIK